MKFVSLDKLKEAVDKIKEKIDNKVSKSGDTMTGDLNVGSNAKIQTSGYVIGTWLKTTANIALESTASLFCVLKDNWIYTRTKEQMKSDLEIPTVLNKTVTLGTIWSGTSAPFTQKVTVSGLLSTDTPILDVELSTSSYESQELDWLKVFKATTASNSLVFYAKEKTSQSLTVKVKVVR